MRVAHALTIRGICPVDGSTDEYKATVMVDPKAMRQFLGQALLEDRFDCQVCDGLEDFLDRHDTARVETVGHHSSVETVCTVDGIAA